MGVVIGFDNKVMAGAWLPGQPENIFRATNLSKRLNIPLVWLVNCSGVKLTEQEKFYANRRGSGTTFYRHAELEQMGIPVLAGVYGTNRQAGDTRASAPPSCSPTRTATLPWAAAGFSAGCPPRDISM